MKAEISTMQEKIDREGAKAPEKQQNEGVRHGRKFCVGDFRQRSRTAL